ncbi:nucleotidyl transferase AbiEii/AbiGii toxin family protein [Runella rosea]|uniref:Nucleotidyl transferase AbiEii/AbiGii toxin family protein n=1 Tax=Runella rosea TaxID=2259595 RepID=A0A344TRV8_9BACT|nr:nucleotidyl transferase AbiEii/AbiGii toxin family protein [Runella rosea]AXE21379.1 nucleotidyl transferase AbiEii/AbiGii toxin family protein [Runella rosea]
MNLHENKRLFRNLAQQMADVLRIPAIYVEKDYWVTYALRAVFSHVIGQDTVFKGGTALSKCYQMIERFSEDIDLVVMRHEGESDNKLKTKLKTIGKVVSEGLPEIEVPNITQKMGMNRKTAHTYAKEFEGGYGQVRDSIIIEATWLGYYEPFTTRPMNSMIGEMLLANNQAALAEQYGLLPFEVRVLEPTRTLCEKIMSLVRFSYGENPIEDLKQKIRHTYDLHQLLQQAEFSRFFQSPAFYEMLLKVATDDVKSFRNNNRWLAHHPRESLIFSEPDKVWVKLSEVYQGEFKNLVYGKLPAAEAVLNTLKMISERLTTIKWTIEIDSNV